MSNVFYQNPLYTIESIGQNQYSLYKNEHFLFTRAAGARPVIYIDNPITASMLYA